MTPRLPARTVLEIATRTPGATRAKSRHLEAQEQRLFVQRWRLDPRTRDLPACAIPNGGKRSPREAALLKAEGVERGAPDWVCFAPSLNRCQVGLSLEFKSPDGTGRQSPEQALWQQRLEAADWRYELVTSAEQAWAVVTDYLGLT